MLRVTIECYNVDNEAKMRRLMRWNSQMHGVCRPVVFNGEVRNTNIEQNKNVDSTRACAHTSNVIIYASFQYCPLFMNLFDRQISAPTTTAPASNSLNHQLRDCSTI